MYGKFDQRVSGHARLVPGDPDTPGPLPGSVLTIVPSALSGPEVVHRLTTVSLRAATSARLPRPCLWKLITCLLRFYLFPSDLRRLGCPHCIPQLSFCSSLASGCSGRRPRRIGNPGAKAAVSEHASKCEVLAAGIGYACDCSAARELQSNLTNQEMC